MRAKGAFAASMIYWHLLLTIPYYNTIVVNVIPKLIYLHRSPWTVLPPGIHDSDLDEIRDRFATNAVRRELFTCLVDAAAGLRLAGCKKIYLGGSYVTDKPKPRDFDICWDPNGIDPKRLDPVLLDFRNGRAAQKSKFRGEFFPSSLHCEDVGKTFLEFFQQDRFTGKRKGILVIPLDRDPCLLRGKVHDLQQ